MGYSYEDWKKTREAELKHMPVCEYCTNLNHETMICRKMNECVGLYSSCKCNSFEKNVERFM